MEITTKDHSLLKEGKPPESKELLLEMTLGKEKWLDVIAEYYLQNYINNGGSKVKILIGKEGTGKTHLLKFLEYTAKEFGYNSIYFSAKDISGKINDISNFYKIIANRIDEEQLIKGLSLKVAEQMGYSIERYDGKSKLLPLLIEEGRGQNDAGREIRKAINDTFKKADLSPSFFTFAVSVTGDRLIGLDDTDENIKIAFKWLKGEKLERFEKQRTFLFETLQKSNARYWLNALIKILNFAGTKGLVILLDDLEVLTEKLDGKFKYTPNAVNDTYELLRQLIDDIELLSNFLLILAGDKVLIDDDKRGLKSYAALWMRLQTGLVPSDRFNPFADMVNIDLHLKSLGEDFHEQVKKRLIELFKVSGLKRDGNIQTPDLSGNSLLRSAVIETALRAKKLEEE